jgi:hypothetical protein
MPVTCAFRLENTHWVRFSGHAVVASGIPNTPLSVSQEFGCEAFWTI